jgi:heme/copper-type cytochrome/quinol oxidase subunit 2
MRRAILIGVGVVTVLSTVVLVPLLAGGNSTARKVVVVARDMSFRLPGQAAENPVIRVEKGETIQLVLQNDDDGIKHDLAVPEWGVSVDELPSGTSSVVSVRVPDKPGRVEYICKRHGVMMKGIIEVGG